MAAGTKQLSELGLTAMGGLNPAITGLAVDSREVKEGFLFAALPGTRVHGGTFIQFALRMGAAAILTDAAGAKIAEQELAASDAALVIAEDPRQALAYTAALYFGAQPGIMAAVTGTNGKTSVATFLRMIWQELGLEAVNLGTTGVEGDFTAPLNHTTPEPITLHRTLAAAAEAGIGVAAMEASSHGLAQCRLDGVQLKAAGFTNFTQDHLDYHETFDEYFNAKAGLFGRVLPDDGAAVINVDDPRGLDMAIIAGGRGQGVITVGKAEADIALMAQRFDATGQDIRFTFRGKAYQQRLNLLGGFQAENVLLASDMATAWGAEAGEGVGGGKRERGEEPLFAFSNGGYPALEKVLGHNDLLDQFEGLVSVDDIKSFKPDPAVYTYARRATGSWEKPLCLVSSNAWDVIGARAAGLLAIWVQRDPNKVFEDWGIQPSAVINSLSELQETLKNL